MDGSIWHSAPLPMPLIGSSSTRREVHELEAFLASDEAAVLDGEVVRFSMDSSASISIMSKGGSGKEELADACKRITTWSQRRSITPVWNWIPRDRNVKADKASKRWDQAWTLNQRASFRKVGAWRSNCVD